MRTVGTVAEIYEEAEARLRVSEVEKLAVGAEMMVGGRMLQKAARPGTVGRAVHSAGRALEYVGEHGGKALHRAFTREVGPKVTHGIHVIPKKARDAISIGLKTLIHEPIALHHSLALYTPPLSGIGWLVARGKLGKKVGLEGMGVPFAAHMTPAERRAAVEAFERRFVQPAKARVARAANYVESKKLMPKGIAEMLRRSDLM
jgi:hypothetical protein